MIYIFFRRDQNHRLISFLYHKRRFYILKESFLPYHVYINVNDYLETGRRVSILQA